MTSSLRVLTTVSAPAIPAEFLRCIEGISRGEALETAGDFFPGDLLQLEPGAIPGLLELTGRIGRGRYEISRRSTFGRTGATAHPDCVIDLMCEFGTNLRAVIVVEVDGTGGLVERSYLLSERSIKPGLSYRVLRVSHEDAAATLADLDRRPHDLPRGGLVANRPHAPSTLNDITNA